MIIHMAGEKDDAENKQKIMTKYSLNANGMPVEIDIADTGGFVPSYEVSFPGIGTATKLLILSFRGEILTMVPIDPTRIENKEYLDTLSEKYVEAGNVLIDKYLPGTQESVKRLLIAYIVNMMLGFGELEAPLADDNLEEIAVNGSREPIWVFHKTIGWCKTNIKLPDEESIYAQAEMMGRRIGREINNLQPLMDTELADGSRVNATLYPISQIGNTLTIRKFEKNPWTMPAMVKNKTVSAEIGGLIWLCVQNEISLLISGGTASGKTSFLNALSIFFPANRRIISVETTRELSFPGFYQWIPMVTRQPNPEGKGEVDLYTLMINALRQRPDIVVIGEVRTAHEAETLFEAIHTGHAVYGTLHADNAPDTILRMTNPPINMPKVLLNAIGGVVVTFRHRRLGIRRILEFGEILRVGDVNVVYRWNLRSDTFGEIGEMTRLADTISLYAGMDRKDIDDDIAEKAGVLEWMVANNVLNVDDAGFIVSQYYKDKQKVLDAVKSNAKFSREMFG